MTEFWSQMLSDSEHVSNMKIICLDGVIISHKIVVASVSNFIKHLIITIPVNDNVTIFMPDFNKEEIENFLVLPKSSEKDIFSVCTFKDFSHIEVKQEHGEYDPNILEVEVKKEEPEEDSCVTMMEIKRDDEDIKALVLRIDSPGGSAFASARIRDAILAVKAAGKPVVVSMGSSAASE